MTLINKKYLTKRNYQVLETVSAVGISFLTKELVKKSWQKITRQQPPENPYSNESSLKEVILFSISLAVVGTTFKLIARDKFAKAWKELDGELPEYLD
ncbi:hypothetical protein GCM10011506_27590 [Marivirga lumbricoides]|uniref:DUF4235 domain-containing protein n=1 Tax=Marivirga lumbricoides TaxID=1046115 RepID=A0A2T4DVU4_9BACT|nr:hypothetical protein C9994_00625 [Marivirga lumbricoides]GGC40498.1 hypothetical protein GCM10011506_27590 [Marivirga lumbricoides]